MRYCNQCGSTIQVKIPAGDSRLRHVCENCGIVHYQNPKLVVGCIPIWEDQLLLCRRAIEPCYGMWTLPAGFMEYDETAQAGAARETLEEAGAYVEVGDLYVLCSLPNPSHVNLLFRAKLLDLNVAAGVESLEVKLFREHEIPWIDLAFPVVRETLWLYFRDRSRGLFHLHSGYITRTPGQVRHYRPMLY